MYLDYTGILIAGFGGFLGALLVFIIIMLFKVIDRRDAHYKPGCDESYPCTACDTGTLVHNIRITHDLATFRCTSCGNKEFIGIGP